MVGQYKDTEVAAFEALGLAPTATVSDVEIAWQKLRSLYHPDKGGDANEFHRIRMAYQQAAAFAAKPKPCPNCNGKGRIVEHYPMGKLSMLCEVCHGSGKR